MVRIIEHKFTDINLRRTFYEVVGTKRTLFVVPVNDEIDPWYNYHIGTEKPKHASDFTNWYESTIDIVEDHDSFPDDFAKQKALNKAKDMIEN
jgi:hypothetical protein